jgi:hypothetical protein
MLRNSETELCRFDDTGDIISLNEFTALVNAAKENADVIVYTYTKSTAIVWEYLENGNSLPDNFRVNISSTDNARSVEYATKLVKKYGLHTCYILETRDDVMAWFESGLPFNNGEIQAIENSQDFAIALHGTFKKGTPEFQAAKLAMTMKNAFAIETC